MKPETTATEAIKIWNEIKDLPLSMYGLPAKTVSAFCTPALVEPSSLYVVPNSSAVLPALEAVLAGRFTTDLAHKYIVVKRAAKSLV